MSNAIVLSGGRNDAWQWDVNIRVHAPRVYERIDFVKDGELLSVQPTIVDGSTEAIVPNQLLVEPGNVYVYGAVHDDPALYTESRSCFRVLERERPADYVLEPTEV